MDKNELIKIFLQRVAKRAYKGSLDDINALLANGPLGNRPNSDDVRMHVWYQNLDSESKEMIEGMLKKTASYVIFGFLVLLDNLTMGYPVEGTLSDFALYVQSYSDAASHSNNQPKDAVRLNHPNNNFDLHDLVMEYLE